MSKIFNYARVDDQVKSEKAIDFAFKSLKNEWNFPEELIRSVANYFECASEGNIFLDQLDAADDMEDAWRRYCRMRGIEHEEDFNPFIK